MSGTLAWLIAGLLLGSLTLLALMLAVMGPDLAYDATLLGWSITLFLVPALKVIPQ